MNTLEEAINELNKARFTKLNVSKQAEAAKKPFAGDFIVFMNLHGYWADTTFGKDQEIGIILEHLHEEVDEIQNVPEDITEFADAFMLLIYAARKQGFTMTQILEAMWAKFEVNKARKWDVETQRHI